VRTYHKYTLKCILIHTAAAAKLLQSCPTLCDPIDSSAPGPSVPGILQARILEWVAISFSNACSLISIYIVGTISISIIEKIKGTNYFLAVVLFSLI